MRKSMYQITKEVMQLASLLEEGELTPEIENQLAIAENDLREKSINYAYVIKMAESDVTAIDEEINRLQGLKKAKANAIDRMKGAVSQAMQAYNLEKIETPTLKISFRKTEAIEIINQDQLKPEFMTVKTTYSPDKTRIKNAIKNGENVEGANLIENYNLQIK